MGGQELTGTMSRETTADALTNVRAASVTTPVRASVRMGAAPNLARQCDRPTGDRSDDRGWRLRRLNNARVSIEESSGNVFADLGLENPEELLAKAELVHLENQGEPASGTRLASVGTMAWPIRRLSVCRFDWSGCSQFNLPDRFSVRCGRPRHSTPLLGGGSCQQVGDGPVIERLGEVVVEVGFV